MAQDVVVPQMGESVLEGTILQWKVKIGDRVEINQPLVELMTDKVNVEIPAETAGILTAQFVKEGEVVPVGTRIATIDDGKSSGTAAKPAPAAAPAAAEPSAAVASAPAKPAAPVKATGEIGKGMMSPKVRMLIREYGVDPLTVIPTGKEGRVSVEDVMRAVEERSGAKGVEAGPVPSPVEPSLPPS